MANKYQAVQSAWGEFDENFHQLITTIERLGVMLSEPENFVESQYFHELMTLARSELVATMRSFRSCRVVLPKVRRVAKPRKKFAKKRVKSKA